MSRNAVLFLIAVLAAPAILAEDEPAPKPETPREIVESALKPVRDQVTNMQALIKRGIVSAAPRDEPDAPPITGWAATCCSRNLRALQKRIPVLEETATRLAQRFRQAGRADGAELATELVRDTRILAQHLQKFAAAPTRDEALVLLDHAVHATINLNIDQRNITGCCNDVLE